MKFSVYWKDIKFLEVEKKDEKYYSKILYENVSKIKEDGFPVIFINNISEVSNSLPKIIEKRLPSKEQMQLIIKNEFLQDDNLIFEYIKETKCERVTDYITVNVEK